MSSILADIVRYSAVAKSHKLVLVAIAAYVERYGPRAFPSLTRLAKDTGLTARHVLDCIKALEELGEIRVYRCKTPGRNARNFYALGSCRQVPAYKSQDTHAMAPTPQLQPTSDRVPAQKSTELSSVNVRNPPTGVPILNRENARTQLAPELHAYVLTPEFLTGTLNLTPSSVAYEAALAGVG